MRRRRETKFAEDLFAGRGIAREPSLSGRGGEGRATGNVGAIVRPWRDADKWFELAQDRAPGCWNYFQAAAVSASMVMRRPNLESIQGEWVISDPSSSEI